MAQVKYLSGGERSRLLLARILKNGGNFLILDEPTNDLDLPTLRILEEALINFSGSVLVVSHDRYFLDRVCTSMIVFEGEGRVAQSVGNYEYYLEKKSKTDAQLPEAPESTESKSKKSAPRESPSKPRKLKYKEQQELAGMENAIHEAEAEVARLEAEISSPDFYKRHEEHTQIKDALHAAREKVSALYARWEELESLNEKR
jgi:ATP-binding cassette subfamily F protein uup